MGDKILYRRESESDEQSEDGIELGAVATRGHSESVSEQCMVILVVVVSLVMAYMMAWAMDLILPMVAGGALDPATFSDTNSTGMVGVQTSVSDAPGCSGGLDDAVAGSIGGVVGVVIMLVIYALIQLARHFGWISEQQAGKDVYVV